MHQRCDWSDQAKLNRKKEDERENTERVFFNRPSVPYRKRDSLENELCVKEHHQSE
jgi:hypothetical protein